MVALAKQTAVRVIEERPPRGYVGPCCHNDCRTPAEVILVLNVGGLIVTAWVCSDHHEALQ